MKEFINKFFDELDENLRKVNPQDLAKAIRILHACYEHGGTVFLIGNGGSSAIASHFANDLNKTILGHKGDKQAKRFRAMSLSDNIPVFTAWANDVGYEAVFASQLKNFAQGTADVLFAISSSGKSANIIKACEEAKRLHMPIIGLVGFRGGPLKEMADAAIHVPVDDYAVVESAHVAVTHLITRYFNESIPGKEKESDISG